MLALLVPSPTSSRASTSATRRSVPASSRAIAAPTMPAPMTATSYGDALSRHQPRLALGARPAAARQRAEMLGRAVGRPARLEDLVGLPVADGVGHRAGRRSSASRAQAAAPSGGGVRGGVDLDRQLREVGLRLHEGARPGQPAVDPQPRQRRGRGRSATSAASVADLGGDALAAAARTRWPRPLLSVIPVNDARGLRVPPRGGQTGEGRDAEHPVAGSSRGDGVELSAGRAISPSSLAQRTADAAV